MTLATKRMLLTILSFLKGKERGHPRQEEATGGGGGGDIQEKKFPTTGDASAMIVSQGPLSRVTKDDYLSLLHLGGKKIGGKGKRGEDLHHFFFPKGLKPQRGKAGSSQVADLLGSLEKKKPIFLRLAYERRKRNLGSQREKEDTTPTEESEDGRIREKSLSTPI